MRSSWFVAALVAAGMVVTACSGESDETPPPQTPSPSSATTTSAEEEAFDCEAVAVAQQELGDAATAELERLAIDRSAPEAFTVVLLETSRRAPQYWAAVAEATTPQTPTGLVADVRQVAAYWATLEEPLEAIEVADSSPEAVQAAADELVEVSQSQPDDDLAPAQQRVQDELGSSCGTAPAPTPSTS